MDNTCLFYVGSFRLRISPHWPIRESEGQISGMSETKSRAVSLTEALERHVAWLEEEEGGVQADFTSANIDCASLQRADLREAIFRSVSMQGTNLDGADLRG